MAVQILKITCGKTFLLLMNDEADSEMDDDKCEHYIKDLYVKIPKIG